MEQQKEEEVFPECLVAFHESIHEHQTVGESILAFQDEFGYKYCEHCGTGIDKVMQCTGCKTVSYCSSECQAADWKEGGHKAECAAIKGSHPWSQYASELTSETAPVASSVSMRHYLRFAAAAEASEMADTEPIGDELALIERGGVGGGGGASFRAPILGGGGFRGGMGLARPALGGAGVSLARGGMLGGFRRGPSLFSRPYRSFGGFRWGGGRGFGGYRYGFWPGWRFPWIYRYGLWFPWWFYISPFYYQTQTAYVDPVTGTVYGVPPAAPGTWGTVAAPPAGQGYTEPPIPAEQIYAPIATEIVPLPTLFKNWTSDRGVDLIERDQQRKQEGKNLAGEKNSGRGPILYKKLTPKQRTTWAKWDRAKQGREIAENDLRNFTSMGGARTDPDELRSKQNRIRTLRQLEDRYRAQADALIGPGRQVITEQIDQGGEGDTAAVEEYLAVAMDADAYDTGDTSENVAALIGSIFTKGKRRPTDEQVQARSDLEIAENELFEAERALEENKGSPIPKNERMLKNHIAAAKKRVETAQAKLKAANKRAKMAARTPSVRVVGKEIGEGELIEGSANWIHGAIKHPGSFRRAAAHADKGKYKGRTMAFAHHVLSSNDHPGLKRKAQLAITLSKLSHHSHSE